MSYKLSDLKENVAVECHNSEEWEAVKSIIKNPHNLFSFKEYRYEKDSWGIVVSHYINNIIGTQAKMEFFRDEEYTIIQAKDFIRDNSPEEEFKVGDWAYVMDKWDSRLTVGKVYQCNNFNGYYHFDNGSGKKDNQCWLTRERFRKAAPHEIPKTNTVNSNNPYNLKEGDKVFLDRYYAHENDLENYDFSEKDEIKLNEPLTIDCVSAEDNVLRIKESKSQLWHAIAKFKPISMMKKSEYIEKIEDLVIGKWYGGKSPDYTYEFCFAGNRGKTLKVSSYYKDGKKYGKDDDFLSFGYFPIKEIPNPEEEIKQYPATISESYITLKKEDFYNCKIDVSESEELSKVVQEKLFELGFKWMISGKKIVECQFISIWYDGDLVYFDSKESFDENDKKQIYPQDLGIYIKYQNGSVNKPKWSNFKLIESKVSDNQIVIPEIKKAIPNLNISIKPIEHIKLPDMSVKPKKVEKIKIEQFSLSI